ncbi:hypothetical protein [Paenibacillus sp. FSL R5-0473]
MIWINDSTIFILGLISMLNNLSREEIEKIHAEIMFKLAAPFPPKTVEFKNANPRSAYIPVHPIQYKVRSAAGPYWSWRITTDKPIYHEDTDEIEMRGVLNILNSSSEGQGFAVLERDKSNKKIQFYRESIRSAVSDAFRDAADYFAVGHQDLAPYRKWAENPGVGLRSLEDQSEGHSLSDTGNIEVKYCLKCGVVLSQDDLDYLKIVRWNNTVCKEHVPVHQKKKNDPNFLDG